MVNDSRDRTCRLAPGDAVLSPWEQDLKRYGPGQVVAATEHRDGYGGTAEVIYFITSSYHIQWCGYNQGYFSLYSIILMRRFSNGRLVP